MIHYQIKELIELLTEARDDDDWVHPVVVDYKSGLKISELQRLYNLSSSGIYFILRREGVEIGDRPSGPGMTVEERRQKIRAKILKDYKAGVRPADLSRKYGISSSGINILVANSGLDRHRRGGRSANFGQRIIMDHNNGMRFADLIKKYRIPVDDIVDILSRPNVREIEDVVADSEAGMSDRDIAMKYGMSVNKVRDII